MARAATGKGVVSISNVEPTLSLMKKYGSKFSAMVRDDVQKNVTPMLSARIASKAWGAGGQAAAVGGTFRAARDRFPAVRGLGGKRVTSSGTAAGYIGFGANWGGGTRTRSYTSRRGNSTYQVTNRHTTRQFGPWTGGGSSDRFIYSTISANSRVMNDMWQDALDRAYKEWNG